MYFLCDNYLVTRGTYTPCIPCNFCILSYLLCTPRISHTMYFWYCCLVRASLIFLTLSSDRRCFVMRWAILNPQVRAFSLSSQVDCGSYYYVRRGQAHEAPEIGFVDVPISDPLPKQAGGFLFRLFPTVSTSQGPPNRFLPM
jgi:hypothetical protein